MLNLITGKRGTPHVSAQDDGTIWRSITGYESCVFDFGSNLSAHENGNTVVVRDGLGMIQGRMFRVEGTETISFPRETGIAWYALCIKITIDPNTDITTAEWETIRGSASNPPTVNTGDIDAGDTVVRMHLYNVAVGGTTVVPGSVTPVYELAARPYWGRTKEVTLSLTSSTTQTKAHGISDIGNWGVVEAYITNGTTYYPLSYAAAGTAYAGYRYDGSNITFAFGSSWSGYTAHVVFGRRR